MRPTMPQLQEDAAAVGMHRIRHGLPAGGLLVAVDAGGGDVALAFGRDLGCLGNDQAGAGALGVVRGVQRMRHVAVTGAAARQRLPVTMRLFKVVEPSCSGLKRVVGMGGCPVLKTKGVGHLSPHQVQMLGRTAISPAPVGEPGFAVGTGLAPLTIGGDGPSRMVKRPTGSGGEPSSPNCGVSAGVKARQLLLAPWRCRGRHLSGNVDYDVCHGHFYPYPMTGRRLAVGAGGGRRRPHCPFAHVHAGAWAVPRAPGA